MSDSVQCDRYIMEYFCALGEPVAVCRATGERNFLSGSAECDR